MTDSFKPHLGRSRDLGSGSARRFSKRVRGLARRLAKAPAKPAFVGARLGSGASAAAATQFRTRHVAAFRQRRVVVKVHIARAAKSGGSGAFKAHLNYIQRDGVERDGSGGELYDRDREGINDRAFANRGRADRHQFRIIVSPEDGAAFEDLKPFVRQIMTRMECDLGTRLDWVAVDHHNTGQPHTHIVVRGKDDRGKDLVITREYLTRGLRHQASELATIELGLRNDIEIAQGLHAEIEADRWTELDQKLEGLALDHRLDVAPSETSRDRFEAQRMKKRLQHLRSLGLAAEETNGIWRLNEGWSNVMKQLGKRGDIIRTLAARNIELSGRGVRDVSELQGRKIIGRIIGSAPDDELRDKRAILVDALDGNIWRVRTPFDARDDIGEIVEVKNAHAQPKPSDRTIAEIAARNTGMYSAEIHKRDDPAATADYIEAHKRRLEALRRAGFVERRQDGSWAIPKDYLDRAAQYEATRRATRIKTLSWISLEDQITALGPSWIDGQIAAASVFGEAIKRAQLQREAFLTRNGMLNDDADRTNRSRETLARMELKQTMATEQAQSGRTGIDLAEGARFSGEITGDVRLAQGRFAIVSNSKEFTLVPWRPELDRYRSRQMEVKRTTAGVSFGLPGERGLSR